MHSLSRLLCTAVMLVGASITVPAWAWDDGDNLDVLMTDFLANPPEGMQAVQQGWGFFTLKQCFASGSDNCWGANPSSPYGVPRFADSGTSSTRLRADEAIVFMIETPPTLRYFSLIPYLHTTMLESGEETLFASVDEPLNNLKIVTTGSPVGGENVFQQLTVAVMTADLLSFDKIRARFEAIGFPRAAVQLLALPPVLVQIGTAPEDDTVTMLMRVAVPDDAEAFAEYIAWRNQPVRVFRLTPDEQGTSLEVPFVPLPRPGSGSEPQELADALGRLVADIQANYATANLGATQSPSWSPLGVDCIINEKVCGGDNYDAVYTREAQGLVNNLLRGDFTIIAGVNHQRLGKAVYINHTISDPSRYAGVASFTDQQLAGSAAYHAGIMDADDPRLVEYQDLYAYAIAPNCRDLEFCLQVPLATQPGDIGIAFRAPYDIVGRIYLDPATKVRPLADELIMPMVLRPQ